MTTLFSTTISFPPVTIPVTNTKFPVTNDLTLDGNILMEFAMAWSPPIVRCTDAYCTMPSCYIPFKIGLPVKGYILKCRDNIDKFLLKCNEF